MVNFMAMMEFCVWKRLIVAIFFVVVNGGSFIPHFPPFPPVRPQPVPFDAVTSGPSFMVMFPAVIESGSNAKLCASLLKPDESLTMTVSLIDDNNTTSQLLQQTSRTDFHHCFNFQAPQVAGDSVQSLSVVVQGRTLKLTEERKVMFRSYLPVTFIQTDKPIYNPGQTVNFRVVTMDPKFVPLDQMYSLVVVEDIRNIRIDQWTNVTSTNWILELSHDLNAEAQTGIYTLKAFIGDRMISQVFEVKQYVLPKFDVTINAPQMYSVGDVGLEVEACGKYTYGEPVPGQVLVEVCRNPAPYVQVPVSSVCSTTTAKTNDTGCASLTVDTSLFFNNNFENNLLDSFLVNVNLTEAGTGVVMSKSTTVSISFEVGNVTFVNVPDVFNYGISINGKILASYYNGTPIANKAVFLFDSSQWPNKLLLNLTTNQNGLAAFSLNTANFPKADLNLMASATPVVGTNYQSPYYGTDTQVISLFQTATPNIPSFSELTVLKLNQPLKCGSTYSVTIKYSFVGEIGDYSADIVYMVLSRGVIVHHGFQKVQARASVIVTNGTVSFQLSVSANMAPVVQILAFSILPSRNVVACNVNFDTEMCFQNRVSVQFSPVKAVPAEGNTLTISAQAGSLCGLSAVDQSVLIMAPQRRLTPEAIFNLLPVRSVSNFPPGVEDDQACLNVRARRAVPADQAYNAFMNVGMKAATNLPIREPQCLSYRGQQYYRNFHDVMYFSAPLMKAFAEAGPPSFDVTIRSYFPETWIWQLTQVGNSGSTNVSLTVPDTITTWETEAFCLSPKGLGLASPALLTVFQPFFLELTLPYSIVRGETFQLKATVFNYLSNCIMVTVTPDQSQNFSLRALDPSVTGPAPSSCLCANRRKTFKWDFAASVLGKVNVTVRAQAVQSPLRCGSAVATVPDRGRIDVVTQSLHVRAEGVERTNTQNWLICPKGSTASANVNLVLPIDVIQGSSRCSVSVLGDIMGRALNDLDGLLKMPYGCGEQNMITLAPNIYIMQYLQATGQLTSAIRDTATGYLLGGYQGELNYRHSDGSYSTFGYDSSNTWLTAFVLRSFGLARSFIYIDPNVLQTAKDWLVSQQGSNGCFTLQGTLYHNEIKGGVNDNVTITAYVVASLLELGIPVTDRVISNGLSCLRSVVGNLQNTYATALLAYTFSLAGDLGTRGQLLTSLNNVGISQGVMLHWSQSTSTDVLAVEISSYVLLAVLSVQPLTTANLGYANRIVNWLVAQQNPSGGFTSTQDTVVALHALSLYAAQVFTSVGTSKIIVQSLITGGDVYNFNVNSNNRLLYQEKPLNNIPGKYTVTVQGSACVSVQAACFYNVPTPIKAARMLGVDVKVTGDCQPLLDHLTLNFTVKYSGMKATTNMVIVDIKLLSGFTADTSLLGTPPNFVPLVDRVDMEDDHVLVYLKGVPKNVALSYQLQLNQVLAVQNLKPAVINVYDYYQTSDYFETTYNSPCN